MECRVNIGMMSDWIQEVELQTLLLDLTEHYDDSIQVLPIMLLPDLDLDHLEDIVNTFADPDATSTFDIPLTEERCLKIEMYQALSQMFEAETIRKLQDILPEVYINSTCTGSRRYKFEVAETVRNEEVLDLCTFRCQLRIVREFLLFTAILPEEHNETGDIMACYKLEQLVCDVYRKMSLIERSPCDCPKVQDKCEMPEVSYIHDSVTGVQTLYMKGKLEDESVYLIHSVPMDCETLVPYLNTANPFHYQGIPDPTDCCHCDICIERRHEDNTFTAESDQEYDLDLVWQAFFDVQTFLEEHAFSLDLSPLFHLEESLSRITQLRIMQWFYENDLHSYSPHFNCPCKEN